ncbi:MAG: hypothetical protein JWL81_2213 [Verrucomicrobiales bacterium]|nr:hypothetical protein [Verrucomicrobiales bacterium]
MRLRYLLLPFICLSPSVLHAGLPVKPAAEPAVPEAPSKPLTVDSTQKLLNQLKEIDASLQGKRSAYNASLLPKLQDAGNNDDKAFALWMDATKDQDFEAQGKSATEFSDFRNGKAKELRLNAGFTTQLRLQCRFLALVILQCDAESDSERLELVHGATAYLDDYMGSAKKMGDHQEEIRRGALDSVIAKHLKLDVSARKSEGPAAYTPGSLSEIYNQMILPYYREKRAAAAISAAWTKRIAQETTLVELTKIPEQLEKFQKDRLPELKWGQAKDLFEAGQQEPAAAAMVALIKANLGHKNTAAWIEELSGLVKSAAGQTPVPLPATISQAPGAASGPAPAEPAVPAPATPAAGPASKPKL